MIRELPYKLAGEDIDMFDEFLDRFYNKKNLGFKQSYLDEQFLKQTIQNSKGTEKVHNWSCFIFIIVSSNVFNNYSKPYFLVITIHIFEDVNFVMTNL